MGKKEAFPLREYPLRGPSKRHALDNSLSLREGGTWDLRLVNRRRHASGQESPRARPTHGHHPVYGLLPSAVNTHSKTEDNGSEENSQKN